MEWLDKVDIAMLVVIAICMIWVRALGRQNAELHDSLRRNRPPRPASARTRVAVVERDLKTNLLVASIPGVRGAHAQGKTLDELRHDLEDVLDLLEANGELAAPESEVVGILPVAPRGKGPQ